MEVKQVLAFILFQLMINNVVFVVEGNSRSRRRSAYFLTHENKRLPDHVVERFTSPSLISCSQSCLQNAWCTSANFAMSSKNGKETCELNKHERSLFDANSKLHDLQGVIFTMILKDDLPFNSATPKPSRPRKNFTATFTCKDTMELFADGISLGRDKDRRTTTDFVIPGNTKIIAVAAKSFHLHLGIRGSFSNGLVTNSSWKCSDRFHHGWKLRGFNDRDWPAAVEIINHQGDGLEGNIAGIDPTAKWIWTIKHRVGIRSCYCRVNLQ